MDIPKIITHYSKQNIHIEIVPDGYLLDDHLICWRGLVNYKGKRDWMKIDVGAHQYYLDTFKICIDYIEKEILSKI